MLIVQCSSNVRLQITSILKNPTTLWYLRHSGIIITLLITCHKPSRRLFSNTLGTKYYVLLLPITELNCLVFTLFRIDTRCSPQTNVIGGNLCGQQYGYLIWQHHAEVYEYVLFLAYTHHSHTYTHLQIVSFHRHHDLYTCIDF